MGCRIRILPQIIIIINPGGTLSENKTKKENEKGDKHLDLARILRRVLKTRRDLLSLTQVKDHQLTLDVKKPSKE